MFYQVGKINRYMVATGSVAYHLAVVLICILGIIIIVSLKVRFMNRSLNTVEYLDDLFILCKKNNTYEYYNSPVMYFNNSATIYRKLLIA